MPGAAKRPIVCRMTPVLAPTRAHRRAPLRRIHNPVQRDWVTFLETCDETGGLRTVVDQVLPLKDARAAHALLEERKHFGKVVLTP